MESSFSENQVVPGDAEYEYDKRVDFDACDSAGWDSEGDSGQFWE